MHTLPLHRRLLLLTEGQLGLHTSKTAVSVLRYRPADVVGVIDSMAAGRDLTREFPWAPPVPILPDVRAALPWRPDALVVGVSPVGGALPAGMRPAVLAALEAGCDVIAGMHVFLAEDAELAAAGARTGARIFDVRRPPTDLVVATARARTTRCRRVLTVGTDGNVGKMVAALELTAGARRRGRDARFVATGQTGIVIAGRGLAIDACVADFAAGATEQLVLDVADAEICFIEGQGSLGHPGFSGVTLALLHGACPDAMILVHRLGRTHTKAAPHVPLPSLPSLIAAYEQVAALLHPARVLGVALNTFGVPDPIARAAARRIEADLDLPVEDPVRDGCERLLAAVLG